MNGKYLLILEDACVCCGAPICEGRQVCLECEKKFGKDGVIIPRREKSEAGRDGAQRSMEERKRPIIETGFRIGKLTVGKPTDQRKMDAPSGTVSAAAADRSRWITRILQRGTVRDYGCEAKVKPDQ